MQKTHSVVLQESEGTFSSLRSWFSRLAIGFLGFAVILRAVLAIVERWQTFVWRQKFEGVSFVVFLALLLLTIATGLPGRARSRNDEQIVFFAFIITMLALDVFVGKWSSSSDPAFVMSASTLL
jgi:hypothetical protein